MINIYSVSAVGCETFQDGSFLVVLNQTIKCHEKSECWGEKEVNIGREVTECSLLPDQTQYLHKDGWQRLLVETESFDVVTNENKTSLKVLYRFTVISPTYIYRSSALVVIYLQ